MANKVNNSAQSTAEYAILIGLVVGTLVVMQVYVKRGIQGRYKDATDGFRTQLSNDANWATISTTTANLEASNWEFEKYDAQRTRETQTGTSTTETMETGGKVSRDITTITAQEKGDYQKYGY